MTQKSLSLPSGDLLDKEMLSSYAYDAVRSAILTGWIPQGTQLIVRRLSQSLDFSPTPIKQALAALEKEGLIVSIPYRGFFVPDLSSSDVMEVFTVRESLEVTAIKLIVEEANPSALMALEEIVKQQEADIALHAHKDAHKEGSKYGRKDSDMATNEASIAATIDLDIAFHAKLAEVSGNKRLQDFMGNLLGPVRLMMARSYSPQRRVAIAESEYKEHRAIVDAIAAGNVDNAIQAVEKHNRDSCMSHLRYFHSSPVQTDSEDVTQSDLPLDLTIVSESDYEVLRVNLVDYLGPLASIVCKDVVARSSSLDEAIEELKLQIPNQEQARAFENSVRTTLNNTLTNDANREKGNN